VHNDNNNIFGKRFLTVPGVVVVWLLQAICCVLYCTSTAVRYGATVGTAVYARTTAAGNTNPRIGADPRCGHNVPSGRGGRYCEITDQIVQANELSLRLTIPGSAPIRSVETLHRTNRPYKSNIRRQKRIKTEKQ